MDPSRIPRSVVCAGEHPDSALASGGARIGNLEVSWAPSRNAGISARCVHRGLVIVWLGFLMRYQISVSFAAVFLLKASRVEILIVCKVGALHVV